MTDLIVARAGNIKNPRNSMPGKTALSSELAKERRHYVMQAVSYTHFSTTVTAVPSVMWSISSRL